ncbi:MAG: sigma-70 family RNA polymerase sigma factor [Chloroflexi bacterium]|nr:sigma-70 family RNA polymerase sigma factor [Chloroflexota bacterium]
MRISTPSQPQTEAHAATDPLKAIFDKFYPDLFAYVSSMLQGREDAPEIVAEAFAITFQHMNGTEPPDVRLRLFRAAHGLVSSALEGRARERELMSLVFDGGLRPIEAAEVLDVPFPRAAHLLKSGLRRLQTQGVVASA